jgi:hypothetical protein
LQTDISPVKAAEEAVRGAKTEKRIQQLTAPEKKSRWYWFVKE